MNYVGWLFAILKINITNYRGKYKSLEDFIKKWIASGGNIIRNFQKPDISKTSQIVMDHRFL